MPVLLWSLPLTKSTPCKVSIPEGLIRFYSLHNLGSLAGTQEFFSFINIGRYVFVTRQKPVENGIPIKSLTADPLDRVPEDDHYRQIGQPLRSRGQRE